MKQFLLVKTCLLLFSLASLLGLFACRSSRDSTTTRRQANEISNEVLKDLCTLSNTYGMVETKKDLFFTDFEGIQQAEITYCASRAQNCVDNRCISYKHDCIPVGARKDFTHDYTKGCVSNKSEFNEDFKILNLVGNTNRNDDLNVLNGENRDGTRKYIFVAPGVVSHFAVLKTQWLGEDLWSHLKDLKDNYEKFFKPLVNKDPKKRIILAGHSMGAAGALMLVSLYLLEHDKFPENLFIYTFGLYSSNDVFFDFGYSPKTPHDNKSDIRGRGEKQMDLLNKIYGKNWINLVATWENKSILYLDRFIKEKPSITNLTTEPFTFRWPTKLLIDTKFIDVFEGKNLKSILPNNSLKKVDHVRFYDEKSSNTHPEFKSIHDWGYYRESIDKFLKEKLHSPP